VCLSANARVVPVDWAEGIFAAQITGRVLALARPSCVLRSHLISFPQMLNQVNKRMLRLRLKGSNRFFRRVQSRQTFPLAEPPKNVMRLRWLMPGCFQPSDGFVVRWPWPTSKRFGLAAPCRMQFSDTADYKSALLWLRLCRAAPLR
jgi:hypothetical protein